MSKSPYKTAKIRVLPAGRKGRGVFAKGDLMEGEVIEFAPVLVLEAQERTVLLGTALKNYAFDLGRGKVGIGLGYTSLYNHSSSPNAEFESSPDGIRIVALRNIRADEEICFDYRWTPEELKRSGIRSDS